MGRPVWALHGDIAGCDRRCCWSRSRWALRQSAGAS